jgi:V/A-type H+-transporting ATPase subunit F
LKKIIFITPDDAAYGFKLAGVTHHTTREEELEALINKLMSGPDNGLVVVDERLLQDIDKQKLREMERRWYGVLIMIPAPEIRGVEVEDYAIAFIKRAIGYHVRLSL